MRGTDQPHTQSNPQKLSDDDERGEHLENYLDTMKEMKKKKDHKVETLKQQIDRAIDNLQEILRELNVDNTSENDENVDRTDFEIKNAFQDFEEKLLGNLFNKFTLSMNDDNMNVEQSQFYELRKEDFDNFDKRWEYLHFFKHEINKTDFDPKLKELYDSQVDQF